MMRPAPVLRSIDPEGQWELADGLPLDKGKRLICHSTSDEARGFTRCGAFKHCPSPPKAEVHRLISPAFARFCRIVARYPTSVKDVAVLTPEKRDRFGVKPCLSLLIISVLTPTSSWWA
jgi:hypothetical protein